ncbi:MAG: pantetheine-phosphate adenylyltransferase [Spirochaetales bacterium]|nr:pantetheine-phosphate adenylyltransferase [Spirochaetales bacterium]
MIKVLFPGSFDPPTLGHLDIIKRCSNLFDHVTVLIGTHPNKSTMFTVDERINLIKEMICEFSNVSVDYYGGLVVEYAKHNDISILIRGVRNFIDFNYESELLLANKIVSQEIETLFMNASSDLTVVKSSLVKELFGYSVDISSLVTPNVLKAMKRRQ